MNKWLIAFLTTSILLGAYYILPSPMNAQSAVAAIQASLPEQVASISPALASSFVKEPDKPASILDETVNKWKSTLAREQGFNEWEHAAWSSYTLGPGSHGWVIILNNDGKEIGYMIVHTAGNGELRLTEYGTGSSPLFSFTTLYHSLIQLELIPDTLSFEELSQTPNLTWERWYLGSLQGVWTIKLKHTTYVLDAKTGESLPFDHLPVSVTENFLLPASPSFTGHLDEQFIPAFDPYEKLSWVQGAPLSISGLDDLKIALHKHTKLTYVAKRYDGKVTCALAVRGYRKWDKDDPYLIVDQNGLSYVPLSSALAHGKLYP